MWSISEGTRARLELMASRPAILWGVFAGTCGATLGIALGLYGLTGSAKPVWALFSIICGGAAVSHLLSKVRISILNRDVTTGCYRRAYAEAFLARIEQARKCVTLALVDLNGLKLVNDQVGHGKGDEFIQDAARRLKHIPRMGQRSIVSRFGQGDEFLLIVEGDVEPSMVAAMVGHALHVEHPYTKDMGLGCAGVYQSESGDIQTALDCADAAMYRAKREYYETKVSHTVVYDPAADGEPRAIPHASRPYARRRDMRKQ